MKIWHVAKEPNLGCDLTGAISDLNYYWQFVDNPEGAATAGTTCKATAGPDGTFFGGVNIVASQSCAAAGGR